MENSFRHIGLVALTAMSFNTAQAASSPDSVVIDLTKKEVLAQLCKETKDISGVKID